MSDASVSSSGTDTFSTPSKTFIEGFRLAYQLAPCSRAYNMPHGRILSPSWPHRLPRYYNEITQMNTKIITFVQEPDLYLHNHSSHWPFHLSLLPLHGNHIFPQLFLLLLRGEKLALMLHQQSSQVHDGASEASPLLTKICGRALPPSITSRCILLSQP